MLRHRRSHERTGTSVTVGSTPLLESKSDFPPEPVRLLEAWYKAAEKRERGRTHNVMILATCAPDGQPSARVVICKHIETKPLSLIFFTGHESRKARELATNPRAAAVFHWARSRKQVRIEGVVERLSEADADAYVRAWAPLERVGARVIAANGASGNPIRRALRMANAAVGRGAQPRPQGWAGYRLEALAVELWASPHGVAHTRVRWTRRAAHAGAPWQIAIA